MKIRQPVKPRVVTRFLVALVIVLALAVGYYQALFETGQKKYNRLEDMYVRVRSQLGVQETDRLIRQSYEQPN